ncbi:hypothetical protein N7468_008379 [Penicillium chermesinum]|uniref:Intracellular protein transport protein n=1 Tax=Penicillium chermesinum TaxID=63820 RepID=A0A9W9NPQ5_9EURO|nr:uncharacterized protein N7468_008379 [Penicillium chermesinum]KAJ5223837.1 hypothetical protein N7468_008379 [Penicillium chermesinum]
MPSNIQVFVKWKDQTIFAGEDVECTITFKNVAETGPDAIHGAEGGHQRKMSRVANHSNNSESFFSLKSPPESLFEPAISFHQLPEKSRPSTCRLVPEFPSRSHKRSVSILSIDSEGQTEKQPSPLNLSSSRNRPTRGHGRSASLQVGPRRNDSYDDSYKRAVRPAPMRGFSLQESPNEYTANSLQVDTTSLSAHGRTVSTTNSPIVPTQPIRSSVRRPQPPAIDFKLPSPSKSSTKDSVASGAPSHQQLARVISATSVNGSARSSGEFFSVSDQSTETLASEYTNYSTQAARAPPPARHARHFSSVTAPPKAVDAQALLMGYAQISASFTVDGSLVNQSVFDEVKRKGVVGGQAGTGGLPGRPNSSGQSRKGGGFWGGLGGFRWNAIEESINGLLSNNDLDGLREMRGVSSSRSIPLLSTPQSLLFVDLRLAPGEEQSYSFTFTLPKGLPASHKGKAIKISYNLVIGTQRPSAPNEAQRVNRINIPFRVYSGVNEKGDILGHDLMVPYVLLRDEAKVQKIGPNTPIGPKNQSVSGGSWHSASEFLTYVDDILEQRARSNSLFPPGAIPERRPSHDGLPQMLSCKDIIDMAILRSNQSAQSRRSPNRFEIARDGQRIAVVVLNRPVHRLGETIIATVDFGDASIPCYAVRASLETSEKVVPTLAVRSNASIHRTTRKIHASLFENTLHATRVVFSPAIPITATPTIITSGVTLDWDLRFEFVTPNNLGEHDRSVSGIKLLETISSDDRGHVLSAMEHLGCESFEISIPLTVFGETVRELLPEENEGYTI